MSKFTATLFAAFLFVSCSNDTVEDLPPPCKGSGYYEIETHYCYQEVREINAGGKNCIITSAAQKGHTYEINCEGRHIGYLDNGKPGEKGESGLNGANGENCSVANVSSGVEITCAKMTVPLLGANGRNGADGIDGIDGIDGTDGNPGIDGQNCTIVQKTEGVEITCGTMELLRHGTNGENGDDGIDGTINGEKCTIAETDDDGWEIKCDGVSLNGKDGDKGDKGVKGDDCTIESTASGVKITCEDILTLDHGENGDPGSVITIGADGYWYIDGVKQDIIATGTNGGPGDGCEVKENGAYWVMTCKTGDTKTVKWPKAMCMMTAYDPEENFCFENRIMDFCGGKAYNPAKEFCEGATVKPIPLCGTVTYTATEFCQDRGDRLVVLPLCGGKEYTDMEYCLSTGTINTYKTITIGTQEWLAENLNFAAEGSKCYNNTATYCDTYGRLYNWATAMALPASCETTSCASQIDTKHRGICPKGWHIPNSSDWDILMDFVQTDNGNTYSSPGYASIAGKYLKATSGWDSGNGEDRYAFAALPSGYGDSDASLNVGNSGFWWSSSEYDSYSAYRWFMGPYDAAMRSNDNGKDYLLSVRCVNDITVTYICGSTDYNPATQFCYNGTPTNKCGGKDYNPEKEFCYNNSKVGDFCGSRTETFDPDLYECKAGDKIYLKTPVSYEGQNYDAVLIGEQTWLAQNLNYNVAGSVCHNNVPANCDTYGRMYEWETALTVCPIGWHLPSDAEFNDLIEAAGGEKFAGIRLKAQSGWEDEEFPNGNGEDTYGFAALPGGTGNTTSFTSVGAYAGFWSSSENDSDFPIYMLNMVGEEEGNLAYVSRSIKDGIWRNVRCLKN
jgi:uncharacterized protein (TIGR02145 family)